MPTLWRSVVLDLGARTAQALVQLARELRTRPLLRAALLAGESGSGTRRRSSPWRLAMPGVHGGYIRVRGRAPEALVWEVDPPHAPVDLRLFCLTRGDPAAVGAAARAA